MEVPPPSPSANKPEVQKSNERLSALVTEVYMQTNKGSVRGELIESQGNERILRVTSVRGGEGIGWLMKLDATNLKAGEPHPFSVSTDGGRTWQPPQISGKLEMVLVGKWERGVPITLDDLYQRTEHHRTSELLPENKEAIPITHDSIAKYGREKLLQFEEKYTEKITAYEYTQESAEYAKQHPETAKFNFPFYNNNANVGWKIHLNVAPENAPQVAEYLKREGYYHKFLTGGEGSSGKAFTVYFGAKSMMDKWSPLISKDLGNLLCKPMVNDEVEVSPGAVARFTSSPTAHGGEFFQYGAYGLAARQKFLEEQKIKLYESNPDELKRVAKDAYERLSGLYGSYFHG